MSCHVEVVNLGVGSRRFDVASPFSDTTQAYCPAVSQFNKEDCLGLDSARAC